MDVELEQFIRSCGRLEALVESIQMAGFKTQDGSDLLLQNKNMLLGHFLKMTRDYSRYLNKAASDHPDLGKTIRFFVADALNVSKEVNDFFLKYPVTVSSLQFASDYGKLFGLLLHSMHKHNAVAGLLEQVKEQKNAQNKAING